ncbi:MAG: Plastidic atp adp transporter [candidate division TM6 bacterium GW2011_GWF2_28_16]|nr:MAG: Plastidic atp adp transporter [candidate division TM6 bacterium GW2011_GWF2_28_16]
MFAKVARFLWGNMSEEELKKFSILSGAYFFLIGSYWLLRVMKDSVFSVLVDYRQQPFAKMVSLFVVIGVVLFYNKLVNIFKRNTLFYIIALFFGVGFITLGYLISHPYLVSLPADSTFLSFIPGKILGWFIYCFIESFGSLMPALFLAIVASSTTTESAKRGYGMMFCFAQLGSLVGTSFVAHYVKPLGFGILFAIGGILISMLPLFMKKYMKIAVFLDEDKSGKEQKSKTGILEGLKLIATHPYIAGILVVTVVYEVISTIVEFQMGICATQIYPVALDGGAGFAWFKALNGVYVAGLSLAFALLGTSFFMRKFGLKFCLIMFPAMIGITIAILFGLYIFGASLNVLMWGFFAAVVVFKGLSYTLNNPSKEVIYIPTSKDVKFKAKSWIDGFGGRTSKTVGSTVTATLGGNLSTLIVVGSFISLGIVAFWIFVAAFVGNKFNELQKNNKIIE